MNTAQAFTFQPIIDANDAPVAVELVYQGRANTAEAAQRVANIVLDAFVHAGPVQMPRQRQTYLEVSPALMECGLLEQLPAELLALVVSWRDMAVIGDRCRELKAAGYCLVLDATGASDDELRPLLPCIDTVRFDGEPALAQADATFGTLRACGVKLLARNVDSFEMFAALKQRGFNLFQGYHFAHPTSLQVRRLDPRKLQVLDLIARIVHEADDNELDTALKGEPELSFELLRIVNSSAFMLKTKIRSIKHAFTILGRKKLERWLQVLLFALDNDGKPSPLMELALRRARFMEFVLQYRTHNASALIQDEAFMTGMLSLMHVEFGWSMEEILERLTLTDEISEALLRRAGTLGRLLNLCEALEASDFADVFGIAESLHLPVVGIMTAQNVALSYAEHIGRETSDSETAPPAAESGATDGLRKSA